MPCRTVLSKSIEVSPNVGPADSLGGIPVKLGGVYAGFTDSTNYVARALNSVASLNDTLEVEVVGPLGNAVRDTLFVTAANTPYPITLEKANDQAQLGNQDPLRRSMLLLYRLNRQGLTTPTSPTVAPQPPAKVKTSAVAQTENHTGPRLTTT